jgi:hypothetical protein
VRERECPRTRTNTHRRCVLVHGFPHTNPWVLIMHIYIVSPEERQEVAMDAEKRASESVRDRASLSCLPHCFMHRALPLTQT